MNFDEAVEKLTKEERLRATVYAMNTLLIAKGVYSGEEFDQLFVQWAETRGSFFGGKRV